MEGDSKDCTNQTSNPNPPPPTTTQKQKTLSCGIINNGKQRIRSFSILVIFGAYPGFSSAGWDTSPSQGYPNMKFASIHLYTWVKTGTMRVKRLAQQHNTVPRLRFELGPCDPESSALTTGPPRIPTALDKRRLLISSTYVV